MSLHRALLVTFVLATFGGMFVFETSEASAQDFTCHPAREHCVAAARDNYTIWVDTDGSMNADSGRDICCGSGTDTYWDVVREELEDFADDNDNSGSCKTDPDPSKCKAEGCDGVRLGIGFFGDDSDLDPESDGFRAYTYEPAGEDKRNDVDDAVNDESAGNIGLPGIETLACPPDGPGQVDTITCPVNGSMQTEEILCPQNGGIQIDEVYCPFDGTAQVHQIRCPADAVKQTLDFTVFSTAPSMFFSISVGPATATHFTGPFVGDPPVTIAGILAAQLAADPYVIANFDPPYAVALGNIVRLVHATPGATSATGWAGFISHFPVPADPTGLPTSPPVGTDYDFDINGDLVRYTSVGGDLSADVCNGLAAELISVASANGHNVTASSAAGIVTISSTVPGEEFTVNSLSSDLIDMGTPTPNLDGYPGDPSYPRTFDFRVNGTAVSIGSDDAAATDAFSLCTELAQQVTSNIADVTASVVAYPPNAQGKVDYRIRLVSDIAGQSFNVTNVNAMEWRNHVNVQPNGPGLPGDPGAHTYDFTLNGSNIQYVAAGTELQADVCRELHDAVVASGEPVTVTDLGDRIRISSQFAGDPFTIGSVDSELTRVVVSAGSVGLPGTPGPTHTYSWDYTDYAGTMSTINVASPGIVNTTSVCSAIMTEIASIPELNATLNASMNQVTITPAIPGFTWSFTNMDPNLTHTTSLTGDLPNNPGPFNSYDININGTDIVFIDDGTPTQAEVCTGVMNEINLQVGGDVVAVTDGSTITITGLNSNPIDITSVEADLAPLTIVREAGLGPSSYGHLASQINIDLNIQTRNQNAIVITHRGPEDYADFSTAVDELCARRDHATAPARTHFIGLDVSSTERDLLSILAAAGGTGTCSGGIDPCAVANSTLVSVTMVPQVSCSGAYSANAWTLDDRLEEIKAPMSCTFELDVPPTYPNGIAPANTNATRVYSNEWDDDCKDTIEIPYDRDYGPWPYWYDLDDCHDSSWYAWEFYLQGWVWPAGGDRTEFTLDPKLCTEVQRGKLIELESHVGCLCANQGDECTAAFTDPLTGLPIPCKSPTHGRCTPANASTVCVGGTATGDCSPDGYCLHQCTVEQLDNMRCATGVYLCDEDTGIETCTAGGDNKVPEICNGIDDDCDGLVDNMSNNPVDAFAGYDTQGRDCNGANSCICPDEWRDVPSASTNLDDHLDSWSGECTCAENLAGPEANMSVETDEPGAEDPTDLGTSNAACSVAAGEGRGDLLLLGLLGLLFIRRRRRA